MADYSYLLDLKYDWDKYGAMAINPQAVSSAEKLVTLLATNADPSVTPLRDGNIQLTWKNKNNSLTIIVSDNNIYEYFMCLGNDETEFETSNPKILDGLLKKVFK